MVNSGFWLEVKRQTIHLLGFLIIIPIYYFERNVALRILTGAILLVLFANWYYEKRQLRNKYFKDLIRTMKLPGLNKKKLIDGANKFESFERKLLLSFLEQFKRKREKQPLLAVFYFLLSSTICFILFGREIAILSIIVLAFGDAASAVVGKKFGKNKLFWNKELSVQGSLAFFAAASLAIYLFLTWQSQFAIISILTTSIFAALIGALTETIPITNDNITIPLIVGLSLWLLSLFP